MRSLIATTSMSASRWWAALNVQRPVLPKPLIATRTDTVSPFVRKSGPGHIQPESAGARIGALPSNPWRTTYVPVLGHYCSRGRPGAAADRRVLARGELPLGRPDLPPGEPPAARAAPARARQAAAARPLGHHAGAEPALRPHEPRDPAAE